MKSLTTLRWLIVCSVLVAAGSVMAAARVSAASAPQKLVYNGHLLDASGNAVATAVTVRFSLWKSADLVAGNVTGTGAINTAASTYAGWKDAFTVTPDARGYFSVQLGSGVALPDFSTFATADLTSLHLQVEVKPDASALTAYEVLDPNAGDTAVDRTSLLSVPFALNADLLDQRHVGTASGAIPLLASGGLLDLTQVPGGTNADLFILDANNSVVAGNITLQFGSSLGKTLTYDVSNSRFDFNGDLRIQGNLTMSGGVRIGNFAPGSGTGAGTLRWTGTDFQGYDGTGWKSLSKAGRFAGTTTANATGSVSTGSLVGYKAGNEICVHQFAGSHMCQVDEIIATVEQDMAVFTGKVNGWASMGAPGYTADANDCAGWTSASESFLGSWWEFSSDGGVTVAPGGGKGYLTNCAVSQPIACCR